MLIKKVAAKKQQQQAKHVATVTKPKNCF